MVYLYALHKFVNYIYIYIDVRFHICIYVYIHTEADLPTYPSFKGDSDGSGLQVRQNEPQSRRRGGRTLPGNPRGARYSAIMELGPKNHAWYGFWTLVPYWQAKWTLCECAHPPPPIDGYLNGSFQ